MAAEDEDMEVEDKAAQGPTKKIIIFSVIVLLLVAISVGGTYFIVGAKDNAEAVAEDSHDTKDKKKTDKKKKKKGEAAGDPVYFSLKPAFVVNFGSQSSQVRFLQVTMDVMGRDALLIKELEKHMPAIRNSIVLLLSNQTSELLSSSEGKEKIRTDVLKAIQDIMIEQVDDPVVEVVYFTGFVMQ